MQLSLSTMGTLGARDRDRLAAIEAGPTVTTMFRLGRLDMAERVGGAFLARGFTTAAGLALALRGGVPSHGADDGEDAGDDTDDDPEDHPLRGDLALDDPAEGKDQDKAEEERHDEQAERDLVGTHGGSALLRLRKTSRRERRHRGAERARP